MKYICKIPRFAYIFRLHSQMIQTQNKPADTKRLFGRDFDNVKVPHKQIDLVCPGRGKCCVIKIEKYLIMEGISNHYNVS